jgi:phage portal protein BeeE
MVEYTQIGMSPADLEILKSLEFDSQELCRVFGVDPILLSVEAASYNNKSEAYKSLVNNVVVPLLNLFQDCLNESINDAEIEIVYDISHFPELQEDLKQQVDALKGADWLTLNEKRSMMNKEPLKDALMDKIYISTSLVPLEEVNIDMSLNNNGDFE